MQNEMIGIAKEMIQATIIERVRSAGFFSIMADGTTDVLKIDQFCLVLRYYFEGQIREDFHEYLNVSGKTTGEELADTILEKLSYHGLDIKYLRGQGYDGASNMCGIQKGVKSRILSRFPKALYIHCGANTLNLAIGDASKVPVMNNMFAVANKVATFFSSSAKRTQMLDDQLPAGLSGMRTKVLCATRWASRQTSLESLLELIEHVAETLDDLSTGPDSQTSSKATSILRSIEQFDFIIAPHVGCYYMQLLLPLSKTLQLRKVDYVMAVTEVSDLISLFKSK